MQIVNQKCKNCSCYQVLNDGRKACIRTNMLTTEEDYCSHFSHSDITCSLCGKLGHLTLSLTKSGYIGICDSCLAALGTCPLCRHHVSCKFQDDPSPLPKVVLAEVRQGNMVMQRQIANPERAKLLCSDCPCFSSGRCLRTNNCCTNYNEVIDNVEYMENQVYADSTSEGQPEAPVAET